MVFPRTRSQVRVVVVVCVDKALPTLDRDVYGGKGLTVPSHGLFVFARHHQIVPFILQGEPSRDTLSNGRLGHSSNFCQLGIDRRQHMLSTQQELPQIFDVTEWQQQLFLELPRKCEIGNVGILDFEMEAEVGIELVLMIQLGISPDRCERW